MTATLKDIGDWLQAWMAEHHASCDSPTCEEPANVLAYLAHRMGLRAEGGASLFAEHLRGYESRCANCAHLRN